MKPWRRLCNALLCAGLLLFGGCAGHFDATRELQWLEGGRPSYPEAARASGIEGYVVLEYRVTADGRVANVRVVESVPPGVFADSAVAAIRSWRYRPFGEVDNTRVVDGVRSRFDFRLGDAYPGL